MKKILLGLICIAGLTNICTAEDTNTYWKFGPLELNIPLKTVSATYLYDFHAEKNLVGAETPVVTLWNKVEGDIGGITSLDGQGTPFVGGNILIGNVLSNYITLPEGFKLGGFGGYDFRAKDVIYGLKASTRIWG